MVWELSDSKLEHDYYNLEYLDPHPAAPVYCD